MSCSRASAPYGDQYMQIVIGTFPFVLHYNATMLLPKIGSALHAHAATDGNSAERILRLCTFYQWDLNWLFNSQHFNLCAANVMKLYADVGSLHCQIRMP